MKKAPFQLGLILAGVIAASGAAAGPYDSWQSSVSDDDSISIADVMSNPVIAQEQDDLWETLNRMRTQGIRRLPVVNDRGGLEGILTADDVLELFAEGLMDLVKLVKKEIYREARDRP